MHYFIALNTVCDGLEIGLCHDEVIIKAAFLPKLQVSKMLLVVIKELLDDYRLSLKDLGDITAMTGPAPFTTLRIVLSTVNGLSYGSGIPLIEVDGLKAFYWGSIDYEYSQMVALIDAFNNEYYYAFSVDGVSLVTGYSSLPGLETIITEAYPTGPVRIIGNGVHKIASQECGLIHDRWYKDLSCNIQQATLAQVLLEKKRNLLISKKQLFPHYLKKMSMVP